MSFPVRLVSRVGVFYLSKCKVLTIRNRSSALVALSLQDFLKYWDILCFVEAAIYSADEENEKMAGQGCYQQDHVFKGSASQRTWH